MEWLMEVLQLPYVRLDGSTGEGASPRRGALLPAPCLWPLRGSLSPSACTMFVSRWLRAVPHTPTFSSTAVDARLATVDRFNHNDDVFAFLLSTRAGGQGLNLTGADTVILHGAGAGQDRRAGEALFGRLQPTATAHCAAVHLRSLPWVLTLCRCGL